MKNLTNYEEFLNESAIDKDAIKLANLLEQATKQAEKIGKWVKDNQDDAADANLDSRGLAKVLEEIYAGFMTGKRSDSSYNDEIFK
jgi:hypothetical protein